ncbi:MAG TPA: hypothetical protein PKX00_02750 [Opitutaceae bacterium]|nr:hypothetical protein [Opitutaceae bacterium]
MAAPFLPSPTRLLVLTSTRPERHAPTVLVSARLRASLTLHRVSGLPGLRRRGANTGREGVESLFHSQRDRRDDVRPAA